MIIKYDKAKLHRLVRKAEDSHAALVDVSDEWRRVHDECGLLEARIASDKRRHHVLDTPLEERKLERLKAKERRLAADRDALTETWRAYKSVAEPLAQAAEEWDRLNERHLKPPKQSRAPISEQERRHRANAEARRIAAERGLNEAPRQQWAREPERADWADSFEGVRR